VVLSLCAALSPHALGWISPRSAPAGR